MRRLVERPRDEMRGCVEQRSGTMKVTASYWLDNLLSMPCTGVGLNGANARSDNHKKSRIHSHIQLVADWIPMSFNAKCCEIPTSPSTCSESSPCNLSKSIFLYSTIWYEYGGGCVRQRCWYVSNGLLDPSGWALECKWWEKCTGTFEGGVVVLLKRILGMKWTLCQKESRCRKSNEIDY